VVASVKAAQARHQGVGHDKAHQHLGQAAAAHCRDHEHIDQIAERGAVGHDAAIGMAPMRDMGAISLEQHPGERCG
jgi:hypothetical protein